MTIQLACLRSSAISTNYGVAERCLHALVVDDNADDEDHKHHSRKR